jgi:hypothetical protein
MADLYKTEGSQSQGPEERDKSTSDLVTEEMVAEATRAAFPGGWELSDKIRVHDALRAVAPMIAARQNERIEELEELLRKAMQFIPRGIVTTFDDRGASGTTAVAVADNLRADIAAAIRARGETTT